MEENYGGILSGRHAGEVETGVDLGIETALAMRVEDLSRELELSNAKVEDWQNRYHEKWREVVALQNNLKDLLIEFNNEGSVSSDALRRIAEVCEIELTREVHFSGSITFDGTVEIPIFEDFDRYEVSVDSFDLSYGNESVYSLNYDIYEADEDSY